MFNLINVNLITLEFYFQYISNLIKFLFQSSISNVLFKLQINVFLFSIKLAI